VTVADTSLHTETPSGNGARSNGDTGGNGSAAKPRGELAAFLRSRRERLTPDDVGLAPGMRRRTPGLRREEVAQLSGVGVTWYTWLEQGRPINASVQVLDAIARTLRLDGAEQAHLYRLAGVPVVPEPETENTCPLPPEVQTILDTLHPLPAAVYNGRYDLVKWNPAYAALFPNLVRSRPPERNALWHLFACPACCNHFVNHETVLPHMVATLRSAFGRHSGEPAWIDFVRRLSAASPRFVAMWAAHDVAEPTSHVKFYRHHAVGDVGFTATALTLAGMPEGRMTVLTPLDDDTRTRLEWLLAHPEAPVCAHHASDCPANTSQP
jgi:transcriptional regulator with XRE-family HTH domain